MRFFSESAKALIPSSGTGRLLCDTEKQNFDPTFFPFSGWFIFISSDVSSLKEKMYVP